MATTYTHTTFAQAKSRLASLLGDSGKVFYLDEELGLYIKEALRFWGLAAHYFRQPGRFTTVVGQAFYDVQIIEDISGNLLQNRTLTDRDLINDSLYQLMEPPITSWASGYQGSEMFTLDEIADLLGKSRDDILRQSGSIVTEVPYTVSPGIDRLDLNESTIHVIRCSVNEVSTAGFLPMWAIDYYQAQATVDTIGFPGTGRPKAFILNYTPVLALDLYPNPAVSADINVYSVQSLPAFSPTTTATTVGLPEDAAWLARYLMMSDLLAADGLSRATAMSQYCQQRVDQGLDLLQGYQSLMWATINGRRMTIGSLGQLDAQRPAWQQGTGTPRSISQLSWNLFAVYPVPDAAYEIEIDIVRKAIVPTNDGDFIQVGREHMDRIYDYAQHIACFKLQGPEFQETLPLLQETVEAAQEHHAAQAGSAINYIIQERQAQSDRLMRPYRRKEVLAQVQQEKEGR